MAALDGGRFAFAEYAAVRGHAGNSDGGTDLIQNVVGQPVGENGVECDGLGGGTQTDGRAGHY